VLKSRSVRRRTLRHNHSEPNFDGTLHACPGRLNFLHGQTSNAPS
jgi:hypothetical protein